MNNLIDRVPLPLHLYRNGDAFVTVQSIEEDITKTCQRVVFIDEATNKSSSCTVTEFVRTFAPVDVK